MKLIIQIPCYNEAATLPFTLADLPRNIEGIDEIETLIIDDGSKDGTSDIASSLGVDHIVRFPNNRGLAAAFTAGIDACLKLGAHFIVNTDGDNQYRGEDIPRLLAPLLAGEADLAIGDRQVHKIEHFSWLKKTLQKLGSRVVRHISGTQVVDTTSGFRAMNREAALRMNVLSRFSYTLETIIQAGMENIAVVSVPVATNRKLRESRLFRGIPQYIHKSLGIMFRVYSMYQPLKVFLAIGAVIFSMGFVVGARFLFHYLQNGGQGHVQSLILCAVLMIVGFNTMFFGIIAQLISSNRQLIEDCLVRTRKIELFREPVRRAAARL